ncbi:MAG: sporulation protein YpjB [Bacillota bacterium]|nr:sporulation protein YpjB [Bacillota bacterium]
MKVKWIQLCMILILLAPINVMAKQMSPIDKLDEISDEALQMVKVEKYDDAKKLLDYFSKEFTSLSGYEHLLTMDQLRIVSVSHDDAVEATVSPNMKYQERMNRLTTFRLVIDAVSSDHQPLWTGMKDQVMATLHHAKSDIQHHDSPKFNKDLNSFMSLYNIIYPSMKIDIPAETIQKLDAQIDFIDDYRSEMIGNSKNINELSGLTDDLQKLFDDMSEDQTDPSIWWVIISTGSIIIMTLSYVGFRKYQGDKASRKSRSRVQKY